MNLIRFPVSMLETRQLGAIPLLDQLTEYTIVAGGAVRRAVAGMKQDSDVDWFFKTDKECEIAVEHLYRIGFRISKRSSKYTEMCRSNERVQLINFEQFESIEKLFQSFDFTICCSAYDQQTNEIVTTAEAMTDLSRRHLVPLNIRYPVATMRRVVKYLNSGFSICRGGWQEIAKACKTQDIDLMTEYID